jgi:hypothetical protein
MKLRLTTPVLISVGIVLLVLAGLLLSRAVLNPGPAAVAPPPGTSTASSTATAALATAEPDTPTPEPSPTNEPLAASVNGYTITRSYLSQTVQMNRVLGQLSGASVLNEEETLQRLITSRLILQGVTTVVEPTDEEVESLIASLEENWGVTDEAVVQMLEATGVERAFMVDSIRDLLTVDASLEGLQEEGHDLSEWLAQQREEATILIQEDVISGEGLQASPTPHADAPTPTPRPEAEVPEVAPDFTLSRAGGGSFTLEEQLEEGPVVLVFFERCG